MANYGKNFELRASTFVFTDWATKSMLSEEAIDKLKAVNIVSLEALSEVELLDLKDLKLQPGDRVLMRREIKRLNALLITEGEDAGDANAESEEESPIEKKTCKKKARKLKSETESDLPLTTSTSEDSETATSRSSSRKKKPKSHSKHKVTTKSLAKDKALQKLLDGLSDVGIKDISYTGLLRQAKR